MIDDSWWIDANQLDDEQADVISLPADGNYLVVGPPGTGKTNLLLLRASYLVNSQRPNIAVLMFTRSLREFVARGSAHYAVSNEKIQTVMRWEQDLLHEHTIHIERGTKTFDEFRREHAQQLASVFDRRPALEKHLDCILVDEIQDCWPEEIELFFRSAKNVFFVGDHRQQIYSVKGVFELLEGRVERKELTKHYRNGEAICKIADAIGKTSGEPPLINSCNYNERRAKSSATFEECRDEGELYAKLTTRLVAQLKAYPNELLGVVSLKNDDVAAIRHALEASKDVSPYLLDDGSLSNPFDADQRICLCNMYDAKGLEFRALHLPFIERVGKMRDRQKKLAFTSTTRAKTSISVYHITPLPGYLEQGREKVSPSKPPPQLSDLFKNRKK